MGIRYANNWLNNCEAYVNTDAKATQLIQEAARIIDATDTLNNHMELFTFSNAVGTAAPVLVPQGNLNFIEVFKGLHQEEGTILEGMNHLTMRIWIQKKFSEDPHSLTGAFHLYVKILDPTPSQRTQQLQVAAISYKAPTADIVNYQLPNANAFDRD